MLPCGPTSQAGIFQSEKNCVVVYDENEAERLLVDIIVNMLFRRGAPSPAFKRGALMIIRLCEAEHQGKT